jgi:EpsI family protein
MGIKRIRSVLLIVLFSATLVGARAARDFRLRLASEPPRWEVIPYHFGEWKGSDRQFDPVYGQDPSDTMLLRAYEGGDGKSVVVYAGYYKDLAAVMELHNPEVCYPAQGWSIQTIGESEETVQQGIRIRAREMIVNSSSGHRAVMWWYNAGTRPFENRLRHLYISLALASFRGRTDGSLVRLETPFQGKDEAAARTRLEKFRTALLPSLERALPD